MNQLSDRIRLILAENPELGDGEQQKGLVKASGASKSVVNQWLADKIKSMRLDYALEIERTLGYNHIWLVLGTGPKRAVSLNVEQLNGMEGQLIGLYRAATKDGRDFIMKAALAAEKQPKGHS
jgi:hypothetical protein